MISFVLPCRNEGDKIRRTLESIQDTVGDFPHELIVIDNASTDGCTDFLWEKEGTRFENVHYLPTDALLGAAPARNVGASLARGDYLAFVDAHMLFHPNWVEPLLNALEQPQVAVVGPAIGCWDEPDLLGYGQRWRNASLGIEWVNPTHKDRPYAAPALGGCMMLWKRDVFFDLGMFDPWLRLWGCEDVELCVRAWLFGWECHLVPTVKADHYFRTKFPYPVSSAPLLYNQMRTAYAHLNDRRVEVCREHWRTYGCYEEVFAALQASNYRERREHYFQKRVRDDDWYWERFELPFAQ